MTAIASRAGRSFFLVVLMNLKGLMFFVTEGVYLKGGSLTELGVVVNLIPVVAIRANRDWLGKGTH